MPIVFVHGVAVRDEDDPQHAAVERLTRGAEWAMVEVALRDHVAPVVRPEDPERTHIGRAYWGDLGARRHEVLDPPVPLRRVALPAALTSDELAEALQQRLFEQLPPALWPAVVRAVWSVTSDSSIPAQLAARSPRRQSAWLLKQVRQQLEQEAPELARAFGPVAADVAASRRRNVRRAMVEVRKPFQEVVPIFVGDVLRYLDGRGRPGAPGAITRRVLEALAVARDADRAPGEPLVVVSHSMGGQLVYDALTAFAADVPGGLPRVDLWCVAGGQVGFFAELGMFLEPATPALVGVPPERLGYLWNAWSSSDVLSFPAHGRVARAHDSDFAYSGNVTTVHTAYLRDPAFYRTLAAKVQVHTRSRPPRPYAAPPPLPPPPSSPPAPAPSSPPAPAAASAPATAPATLDGPDTTLEGPTRHTQEWIPEPAREVD